MQKKNSNLPPPLEITDLQDGVAIDRAATADCRCEMRVTQAEGAGIFNPSSPGGADAWSIIDFTNAPGGDMEISGLGDHYNDGTTPYVPLPSPWVELNAPSDGTHTFVLSYTGATADLILHTEVRCFDVDKFGQETLATTTFHNFDLSEGQDLDELNGVYFADFCRNFACQPIPASEQVTTCLSSGGGN